MPSRLFTIIAPLPVALFCWLPPAGAQALGLRAAEIDSELRPLIQRYSADRGSVSRTYDIPMSRTASERMARFYGEWLDSLEAIDFEQLSLEGQVDWLLFRNHLQHRLRTVAFEAERNREILPLIPFAFRIVELAEAHQRMEPMDAEAAATRLNELDRAIEEAQKELSKKLDEHQDFQPTVANRAASRAGELRRTLQSWHAFYDGYDPLFSWWTRAPYQSAHQALKDYAEFLRKRLVGGQGAGDPVIGDPIGREALLGDLAYEMIPYTPEELIEEANRQFAWCDAEMLKASNELGFGDDWRAAQQHVKSLHAKPGGQPELIRELAHEAVDFLEARELLTIPELAKESWRRRMMSPERQKVSPYFLGGETILISFPTDQMEHDDKLMSMRGNNIHFARATVHHELIPGHHLQGFMLDRHATWRRPFGTPFWLEGWALYWELRLWDLGFARSPEDRIGMLFWRKHRCARIIFSLSFHLERMTAQEAIDFLVERVGHERNNATAEVRRSVNGDYSPLYQCAYLLGGLQIRALHDELVPSDEMGPPGTMDGRMTERAFHDAVLQGHSMPIEMVRARLTGRPLSRDHVPGWRFLDR